MIQVKRIIPQTVTVYDPLGWSLGSLNEYEFNDLRIQIAKEGIEGYYAMFNEHKIPINKYGAIHHSIGMFDLGMKQVNELLKTAIAKYKKEKEKNANLH